MEGIVAAAHDPDSDKGPGPRGKLKAAADYLEVAPTVVAVARDIDFAKADLALPRVPRDPDVLADLADRYSLTSAVERLRQALDHERP
jgi:hypothetical protein